MRTVPGYPNMAYDQTLHARGTALSALNCFTEYPEECLPVLIEAMHSFEEFDPDECYHGPQSRIAGVVVKFGPKASSAVASLIQHLEDDPEQVPTSLLEALVSIGPAAKAALPALRELQVKFADPDEDPKHDGSPIAKHEDLIGWAIQQFEAT